MALNSINQILLNLLKESCIINLIKQYSISKEICLIIHNIEETFNYSLHSLEITKLILQNLHLNKVSKIIYNIYVQQLEYS